MPSRFVERSAALALLAGIVAAGGATAWNWADTYSDGQREIADRRMQLRNLRDLAEARAGFARLTRRADPSAPILPADGNPQDALAAAVAHAAEGQQVVVDSVDALPLEPTLASATVRLRGTQAGLHGFLRAIEAGTPYLLVPRLEVELFRSADVAGSKPLILRADLRVAALVAPAVMPRPPAVQPP